MASVGIINVYDKIIRSKGEYCKVCFRTSRERKLVTPVFFGRFLITFNSCRYYNSDIKVCFVCERLAMSAMKFHHAVVFGRELEELFGMIQSEGVRDEVLKHLDGVGSNSKAWPKAKACEKKYQQLQDSLPYSLQCTNTLLVSMDAMPAVSAPPARVQPQGMGTNKLDKPQGTGTKNDAVVILDDDDPPPLNKPTISPQVGPAVQIQGIQVGATEEVENNVVLHPIITGVDGKLYVPSLSLQVLPHNNFATESEQTIQVSEPKSIKENDRIMDRIDKLTMGYNYQDFLRLQKEQNENTETIRADNLNIVFNFDDRESSSKRIRFEEDPLKTDTELDTIISDAIQSAYKRGIENGIEMKNDGKEKQPVLSMSRVDWEDKIPMDVISFMDATDPNPRERIMQPNSPALGIISNVRSMDEGDVEIVENIECIDLC